MSTTPIPLSKLRLSPRNARDPKEGDLALVVHDLQANILAHGLMTPLTVHKLGRGHPRGTYGVVAGGRRLRALQGLQADGRLPAHLEEIDCYITEASDVELTEMSISENLLRVAMKPVEEYEAFALLASDGADEAAIAERFGTTVRHVQQRMRLGRLHPDILAALDARAISDELARAYASTADQALQIRVYGEMSAGWQHQPHNVRNAIRGGSMAIDTDRMLRVVGVAAYLDAGGQLEEDFFTEQQRVLQRGTLEELYYAKVAEQEAALKATLPEHVSISTSSVGVGQRIFVSAKLPDAQAARLQTIDARAEEIHNELEMLGDMILGEAPGEPDTVKADRPADQEKVDALCAELDALETEGEAIHADASEDLPAGPVIAVVEPRPEGMRIIGYHRPAGWTPDDASPAERAPIIDPGAAAKAGTGLTIAAADVMKSHRRAILRGAMVIDNVDIGHRFLLFTLARLAFNADATRAADGDRGYHHDYASTLGIAGSLSSIGDPVGANEVADQNGGNGWAHARKTIGGAPWMRERDAAAAFHLFCGLDERELERIGAALAAHMLVTSLAATGNRNALHTAVADKMGLDDQTIRSRYWTPDAVSFEWLPKGRKIDAVAEVSPKAAKAIAKLPTADISAACARFFAGDAAAIAEFGLIDAEARYARMWVPSYLRFNEGDPPWVVARGATKALETVS